MKLLYRYVPITVMVAAVWLALAEIRAEAQSPPIIDGDAGYGYDGAIEVGAEIQTEQDELQAVADTVATIDSSTNQPRWLVLPSAGSTDSDDYASGYAWCRDVRYENADELGPEEEALLVAHYTHAFEVDFARRAEQQGWPNEIRDVPCPLGDMQGLPAALVDSLVRDAVLEQLPRPEPRIPPGYALTGMPAYLVSEHALSFGPVADTLNFGFTTAPVTMSGTATSTVHWGDGTTTTHDVVGLPYPDGEVVHTYTDRGSVTVQVVDTWTVSYDVADGALSGTIEAALDPVSIIDFEIREYRAVRVSPDD